MTPDQLQKLRRFSLALGVILFSYVVADFRIKKNPEITLPFAIFEIGKPYLIPIGLVVASVWGMVLYWYYGLMLERTPSQQLGELLKRWEDVGNEMYEMSVPTKGNGWSQIGEVRKRIPRFANRDVLAKVTEGGARSSDWVASICIARRQKVALRFQDFDYTAPIWLNLIALGVWFYSIGLGLVAGLTIAILCLGGIGIYKWSERPPPYRENK